MHLGLGERDTRAQDRALPVGRDAHGDQQRARHDGASHQHAIELDHFVIYEVPTFDEFREAPGEKSLSVALAFDPPVRRRRQEYLAVEMGFQLIRGKTLNKVEQAYGRLQPDEDAEGAFTGWAVVKFVPTPNACPGVHRKKSTLQKGTWRFKRDNREYGDHYWLAIRCQRRWAPADVDTQEFGLAVTYRADEPNLNNLLRARLEQRVRARRSSLPSCRWRFKRGPVSRDEGSQFDGDRRGALAWIEDGFQKRDSVYRKRVAHSDASRVSESDGGRSWSSHPGGHFRESGLFSNRERHRPKRCLT